MHDKISAIVSSWFYVFSGFVGSSGFGSVCLVDWVFVMEACLWSSVKQAEKERHQGAKV